MTLGRIALANLKRRKGKAAFVLAGLFIGVATFVALVSLTRAMTAQVQGQLEKYGANILIVPRTQNLSLAYGGLVVGGLSFRTDDIRQADLARIRTIKNAANIAALGPMVLGVGRHTGRSFLLAGVDWKAMRILRPWWKWNGKAPGRYGVLVGAEAARLLALAPGGRLTVNGRNLTVAGVLGPTGSQDDQLVFAGLATAQEVLGKPGLVSLVEVAALCNACPVDDMVLQIGRVLPGTRVMSISQVVKGRMATLGHFRRLSYGISIVVALVCGLLVLVTMMGGVRERTAEIGVFRAIGFRRGHVSRIVMIEAALLSLLAGVLGYAAGSVAAWLVAPLLSGAREAAMAANADLAGLAVGLAVLLGLGGSLYPALMAARLDPSEALRAL